jgi:glycerol-3-phosphate acyltransferase PlsY
MLWIEQIRLANWREAGLIAFGAYVLGCFTTGYYLVRRRVGEDIRELGSGSVGARNVGRILGPWGFFITLLGDFAKGAFAVWAARQFAPDPRLLAVAMLAVVAGHIWPAQLWFHGGKGVATSLGALAVYDFHLALAFGLTFGAASLILRNFVLAGLAAFASLPWLGAWLGATSSPDYPKVWSLLCLAVFVWIAHRKNLMEELSEFLERRNLHPKQTPPDL